MTETPSQTEPTEWDRQRWKEAERAHDFQDKAIEMHYKQIEAFAVLTIRSLALTCAGGIAATLGFYSANFDRLSQVAGTLGKLNAILAFLFVALILTLLTAAFGYFSQMAYAKAIVTRKRNYTLPYVEDTEVTSSWSERGDACRMLAVAAAVGSAACLILAGFNFVGLVH